MYFFNSISPSLISVSQPLHALQIKCIIFLLLELDEDDQGRGEPRAEPRNAGRGERWRSAPFTPNLVQFQVEEDELIEERTGWQPLDYVEQYIDSELMKVIADG